MVKNKFFSLPLLGFSFVLGVTFGINNEKRLLLIIVAILAILLLISYWAIASKSSEDKEHRSADIILMALFSLICFLTGLIRTFPISKICPPGDICNALDKKIEIRGKIISWPSERLEKTYLEIQVDKDEVKRITKNNNSKPSKIQVVLPHSFYDFGYLDEVLIFGRIGKPRENEEENFSYPLYLASHDIFSIMYFPAVLERQETKSFSRADRLVKGIVSVREKIRKVINDKLKDPESAVIKAIIIGDQSTIPKETRDGLSKTGIIHILSVSGSHITFFIIILSIIFSKCSINRTSFFAVSSFLVILYVLISGLSSCAERAAIMGLVTILALTRQRLANLKVLFWLALCVLVWANPLSIMADIGFQLSFLAVIGIIYVHPMLLRLLTWGKDFKGISFVKLIIFSVSISLTTTPLVAYYFGLISFVSPFANLMLLPALSLFLPLGFILALLGILENFSVSDAFKIFKIIEWIIDFIATTSHFLWHIVETLNTFFLKIPFSFINLEISTAGILLYYSFFLLFLVGLKVFYKKIYLRKKLSYFKTEKFLLGNYLKPENPRLSKIQRRARRIFSPCFRVCDKPFLNFVFWGEVVFSLFLLFLGTFYFYHSGRPSRLMLLDVGQGDAILIDFPKYHLQMLIDGGSGRKVASQLGNSLPFYDRKIEFLLLTHYHSDHLGGFLEVLEKYDPAFIILPYLKESKEFSLENYFYKKFYEREKKIFLVKRGDKILFNNKEKLISEFEFISPFFGYTGSNIKDENNKSAVIKMSYPKKALFMGDLSKKGEKILLLKESHNLESEILKVGHHGSRFSTSNEFLKAVSPNTALVSVGKDNLYGHPARETIKKLEERGIKIFRTDEDGGIEINL